MKAAAVVFALLAATPLGARAAENGRALYLTYCSSCHGNNGRGTNVAPSLVALSASYVHFMLDSGRMPAPAPDVNEIPRVPRFTYAQIDTLTKYVLSLSPRPGDASLPIVANGNPSRGRALYAENCQQCHGAVGDGASVGSNDVAPDLATATVFQIGEAIRAGPGIMPRFDRRTLSDADVSDIAFFIRDAETHANEPDSTNAGGFPLAHLGPAPEGFIAWLFGMGALVLFIRGIGTAGKDS